MPHLPINKCCLFCTTEVAAPIKIIINGEEVIVKTEKSTESDFLVSSLESERVINAELQSMFIVHKILDISPNTSESFLSSGGGLFSPSSWFSVCVTCRTCVLECYRLYCLISRYEKRLTKEKSKLKQLILESEKCSEKKGRKRSNDISTRIRKEVSLRNNLGCNDNKPTTQEPVSPNLITDSGSLVKTRRRRRCQGRLTHRKKKVGRRSPRKVVSLRTTPDVRGELGKAKDESKADDAKSSVSNDLNETQTSLELANLLQFIDNADCGLKSPISQPPDNDGDDDADWVPPDDNEAEVEEVVTGGRNELSESKSTQNEDFTKLVTETGKQDFNSSDVLDVAAPPKQKRAIRSKARTKWRKTPTSNAKISSRQKIVKREAKRMKPAKYRYLKKPKYCDIVYKKNMGIPFYCDHCQMIYTSEAHLHTHFGHYHAAKPLCRCEHCGKEFVSKQLLRLHSQEVHPDLVKSESVTSDPGEDGKCPHCPEQFPTLLARDYHIAKRHQDKLFTCKLCGHPAKKYCYLLKHLQAKHAEGTTMVLCDLCTRTFKTEAQLTTHRIAEHYDKLGLDPWKCKDCASAFGTKQGLKDHENWSHNKMRKERFCEHCGKAFARLCDLRKHILLHTAPREEQYKKGPFFCEFCDAKFNVRQGLFYHLKKHHSDKFHYRCEKCGKGYHTQNTLNQHLRICKGKGAGPVHVSLPTLPSSTST